MANIKFRKDRIIPTAVIIQEAFWISLSVAIVRFVIDFFGMGFILGFFPDAFRIFLYVILGVYLRGLFDIKIFGREIF
jgi:hypothetical protein|tara:strand:+ start:12280 stop:12513 length:234 start_codon:yes stop_codon:yes gene_type:complete